MDQAEQLAFLVVAFRLQPSEVRNLTGYEVDALIEAGRKAEIIK
jgi:hypothetical protein